MTEHIESHPTVVDPTTLPNPTQDDGDSGVREGFGPKRSEKLRVVFRLTDRTLDHHHDLTAHTWQVSDDGRLLVLGPDDEGDEVGVAEYAPGTWLYILDHSEINP